MTTSGSAMVSLGIDVGGTKTHGILLDADTGVLAESVLPTSQGPDAVVAAALAVADACLRHAGIGRDAVGTVGVGIPGRVDHCTGVVRNAVNLSIDRLDLGTRLAAEFGRPVAVDNDVKAAALGAAQSLGATDADLTYLNLGTGVAAATLAGGRLLRGADNLAGEVGHIAVDPQGQRCACGQRGCLEVTLGGGRIAARLAPFAPRLGLANLVEAADAGDPDAGLEVRRISSALATAVQLLVLTQGSSRVVLGGGVVHTAPGLVGGLRRVLAERAADSEFLASLDLPGRVSVLPSDYPVAAIGAALVGRTAGSPDR